MERLVAASNWIFLSIYLPTYAVKALFHSRAARSHPTEMEAEMKAQKLSFFPITGITLPLSCQFYCHDGPVYSYERNRYIGENNQL